MKIKVTKVDFDTKAGVLHLNGYNVEENQYVKRGAYHTVDLMKMQSFTVYKELWDTIALGTVATACDPVAR
jgi:protein pelota